MNIRQATDADNERWDHFVCSRQDAAPYQLSAWTRAIKNAYGFKSCNLIAEENGHIVGILPMSKLKTPCRRPQLVALPYCDVGNILATNQEVKKKLLTAALDLGQEFRISALDLRGALEENILTGYRFPVQTTSNKVRMLLSLPASSQELWDGFKSKLRSQVRKAKKNGLSFQFNNHKIDDFYTVFSRNMRDLGSPVHAKKWFEEIIRQFDENAKLGLVYSKEDMPIGAGLILRAGHTISIPWASTLRTYNRLNPNMLLYWNFLKYAADSNAATFDFGRSTPNEGTYRFKAQWGAEPTPLKWHRFFLYQPPSSGAEERRQPPRARQQAAVLWKKLPLGIANLLGSRLRKYISL